MGITVNPVGVLIGVFLSLLLPPSLTLAEDKPAAQTLPRKTKVAVFDMEALSGVESKLAELVTECVSAEARGAQGVEVMRVKELEAMLGYEQQKQMAGCNDTTCAVALGGAFGVDKIVMGTLGKVGQTHVFNLKLIDVKAARVENQYYQKVTSASEEKFLDAATAAVAVLFGQQPKTGATVAPASPPAPLDEARAMPPPKKERGAGDLAQSRPTTAGGEPPVSRVERPASGIEHPGLGHGGQFSLTLRGYADHKFSGGAGDLALGYAVADWIELSAGAGFGQYFIVKPRAVAYPIGAAGALKPNVFLQGGVVFARSVEASAGGGIGLLFDLNRNVGLLAEVPVEYFFNAQEGAAAFVVLFSLGIQARM
ncbi:MAG: hypothetical protein HY897_07080 [Deltaproteobacteria bacterium]|nr:hypothetical protein [Deltaproteobacteria bacterium]